MCIRDRSTGASVPAPAITNPSPADGAVVTKPVPISATFAPPAGQSIASWSVSYRDLAGGSQVLLASGGSPVPATLATFDPTLLPNDTYSLTLSATASGGGIQSLVTTVMVAGNLKTGRYVTTFQDLSVPISGFLMRVTRVYDSIDKRVGDFGVGWHVGLSNFHTSTNRQLGAGGWTQYDSFCAVGLCLTAFRSSTPHYVVVVFPDGHDEAFDFTPSGGTNVFLGGSAAFTPRPGTTSALQADGNTSLAYSFDGNLYGSDGQPYDPQRFKLTTHDGRILFLDKAGGLISETDRNGNFLTVSNNGITASTGVGISYMRDTLNRITQITGPTGQVLSYAYSSQGDLQSDTDANGNLTTFSYDTNHDLTGSVGPNNRAFQTLTYDSTGHLIAITDGNGNTTKVSNLSANQQSIADANGRLTTLYTYDDLGDVVERDDVFSGQTISTKYTFDVFGHVLTKTDSLGHVSSAAYDSSGNLVQFTDAVGRITRFSYNTFGQQTQSLGADGSQTVISYDPVGNLLTLQRPDGSAYKFSYDQKGNRTAIVDPAGRAARFSYDSVGHLASVTDPSGHVSPVLEDGSGRLTSITDALQNKTTFSYDANGNRTAILDANGHSRGYSYDFQGRLLSAKDALGRAVTLQYDAAGNLSQVTNRNGQVITYTYDPDGRLASQTLPGGDVTTYAYDPLGRPTGAANGNRQLSFLVDGLGQILSTSVVGTAAAAQAAVTLNYAYDPIGLRLTMTGPEGTTQYGYDTLSRLTSVLDPSGRSFGFSYNAVSQLVGVTRPNGVNDQLSYDSGGILTKRVSSKGSTILANAADQLDPDGLVGSLTDLNGTNSYTYDTIGQLLAASHPSTGPPAESYSYDPVGNRLTASGVAAGALTYDAANRLTADASFTYTYDNEGDLVSRSDRVTSAVTSFSWNANHQLLGIHYPNGTATAFRYDPLGRRVEINVAGQITRYVYDGSNIHLEDDANSNLTATYTSSPAADSTLEMVRGGQPFYYLQDGLNSTTALTDSSGVAVQTYTYDSFGRPFGPVGPVTNPLTFTGREYDPSSGLYYDRARYYDPSSGRFLSEDPLIGTNPYSYVQNNPVNLADPTGLQAIPEYTARLATLEAATAGGTAALAVEGEVTEATAAEIAANLGPEAANFEGVIYRVVLTRAFVGVRFFGGPVGAVGRYMTTFSFARAILGFGAPARAALQLAPGNLATQAAALIVPAGQVVYFGAIRGSTLVNSVQVFVQTASGLILVSP